MPEFEIKCDRNNFVDLQKIYRNPKTRCKAVQANGANLRYDNNDTTVFDSPTALPRKHQQHFLVNNSLYSLFCDCTLSANGLKISNANSNFTHKSFI